MTTTEIAVDWTVTLKSALAQATGQGMPQDKILAAVDNALKDNAVLDLRPLGWREISTGYVAEGSYREIQPRQAVLYGPSGGWSWRVQACGPTGLQLASGTANTLDEAKDSATVALRNHAF